MTWRIYYADGSVVEGTNRDQWQQAPDNGVQVVVSFPRKFYPVRWHYEENGVIVTVTDRDLWTGEDSYDQFGFGVKQGSLITDEAYSAIWRRACADSQP